jgi:putative addiction module killer protein
MIPAIETEAFSSWLDELRDRKAVARINTRIIRLRLGNPGDVEPVGEGVSELRFMFGPGYRVYYAMVGKEFILLLGGGDKGSQATDIEKAKELWRAWKDEHNG